MSRSLVTTKLNSKYTAGGSGGTGTTYTIGTLNNQTKSANGLVITGSSIYAQTADNNYPGLVSTGTQTFKGVKTFYNNFTATANGETFEPLKISTDFTSGGYLGLKKSFINFNDTLYLWDSVYNTQSVSGPNIILGSSSTGNSGYITGNSNIIMATSAGSNLTSGSGNLILGWSAGPELTSGNYNIFLGSLAGNVVTNGNNNIAIGKSVNTATSADTNSIIIGAENTGMGSNTVLLGNNSITKTYLKGVVNVNTSNYTASQLLATDANKNIVSLDTGTYPTLAELSYVRGVTSGIQTQLDSKLSNNITDVNSSGTLITKYVTKYITLKNTGTYDANTSSINLTKDGSNTVTQSNIALSSAEAGSMGTNTSFSFTGSIHLRITSVTNSINTTNPTLAGGHIIGNFVGGYKYSISNGGALSSMSVNAVNVGVISTNYPSIEITNGVGVNLKFIPSTYTGGGTYTIQAIGNFMITYLQG